MIVIFGADRMGTRREADQAATAVQTLCVDRGHTTFRSGPEWVVRGYGARRRRPVIGGSARREDQ